MLSSLEGKKGWKSGRSYVAVINYHELGGLKQQKFILLQLWRSEVQNQGVLRSVLTRKALGSLSLPLSDSGGSRRSLAFGSITAISDSFFHRASFTGSPCKETCHWI